jgi:hypothetical protein
MKQHLMHQCKALLEFYARAEKEEKEGEAREAF